MNGSALHFNLSSLRVWIKKKNQLSNFSLFSWNLSESGFKKKSIIKNSVNPVNATLTQLNNIAF